MKVQNIKGKNGRAIPNQFIIEGSSHNDWPGSSTIWGTMFQSYDSNIVFIPNDGGKIRLDSTYWDHSVTTGKYRNQFLGETKKETQAKIDSGEYILVDLN